MWQGSFEFTSQLTSYLLIRQVKSIAFFDEIRRSKKLGSRGFRPNAWLSSLAFRFSPALPFMAYQQISGGKKKKWIFVSHSMISQQFCTTVHAPNLPQILQLLLVSWIASDMSSGQSHRAKCPFLRSLKPSSLWEPFCVACMVKKRSETSS